MNRIPITLAVFAVAIGVALLAASFTPLSQAFLSPAHAQDSPTVAVELSSTSVDEGTAITVTMSFLNLEQDSDRSTTDYIFRADVVDADGCEDQAGGYGLGVERYMYQVDEDPETRRGTISAGCPAGVYTLRASISDSGGGELASATAGFSVTEAPSEDATLRSLALSGVDIGAFDPETTTYTAEAGNEVEETTVSPAVNDDRATYAVQLDGVADEDGNVPLAVGGNVITIEVTAEDGETTMTYAVTVTRAEALSSDATLSGLDLSGIDFGAFDSATTGYTAGVANDVEQTTVTATTNDDGATYTVKLDGVADDDGTIPLGAGENAISVLVTAEDGETTRTYTATVTRAKPGPVISIGLSPSDTVIEGLGDRIGVAMSFGDLTFDADRATIDYVFRADVVDADECEGSRLGVDRYVYQVDENPENRFGRISAGCPAGAYTLRTTLAVGGQEIASHTVQFFVLPLPTAALVQEPADLVSQHAAGDAAVLTGLLVTHSENQHVSIDPSFHSGTYEYAIAIDEGITDLSVTATPAAGATTAMTYRYGADSTPAQNGSISLAGRETTRITITVTADDPPTTAHYTIRVARRFHHPSLGIFTYYHLLPDEGGAPLPIRREDVPWLHTQAASGTLSALELTGIPLVFDPATLDYAVSVGNAVERTTVTFAPADEGASYEVTLDGETDEDGTVELAVGENVITVLVTAEDGNISETYTVTVTRAEAPAPQLSADATLRTLALSGVTLEFDPATINYAAEVGNGVAETAVTPAVNGDGATYVLQLNGVEDPDGTVELAVGENVVAVVVTAEDGETAKTYTVTLTRAAALSTDATLKGLALSGVNLGTFDPATTGYTAEVADDLGETTVTPTTNHAGATYLVNLDGAPYADGAIPLGVGENVITVLVTAEDGNVSEIYTVTVTRAEAPDPTVAIELSSGSVEEGTEITVTMSFANLTPDNDADLVFRAGVVGADACEGERPGRRPEHEQS